jgi:hypothetical protein
MAAASPFGPEPITHALAFVMNPAGFETYSIGYQEIHRFSQRWYPS